MTSNKSVGTGLPTLLFIIFLVLKLTNNIDWSWWWVTSPLWITLILSFLIVVLILFGVILAMIFGVSSSEIINKIKKYKE